MTTLIVITALGVLAGIVAPILVAHRRQLRAMRQFNSLVTSGREMRSSGLGSRHE